jgi:hypothetical protein
MSEKYEEFAKHMEQTFPKMFGQPYGGFAIGEGWYQVIESLCNQIQGHIDWINSRRELLLKDNPYNNIVPELVPQVAVLQIKEKFGGLRFYYDGGDDYIRGLVSMAEVWASKSCEVCGAPGSSRGGGWVRTLCDHHEQERQQTMK